MSPEGAAVKLSEHVEQIVDDVWQIADGGDQELQKLSHSSRRDTLEPDAGDYDGLSQQACIAPAEEHSACVDHHASATTDHAHISGSP